MPGYVRLCPVVRLPGGLIMFSYARLCPVMPGYVRLCPVVRLPGGLIMFSYVRLCPVMSGYARLCPIVPIDAWWCAIAPAARTVRHDVSGWERPNAGPQARCWQRW